MYTMEHLCSSFATVVTSLECWLGQEKLLKARPPGRWAVLSWNGQPSLAGREESKSHSSISFSIHPFHYCYCYQHNACFKYKEARTKDTHTLASHSSDTIGAPVPPPPLLPPKSLAKPSWAESSWVVQKKRKKNAEANNNITAWPRAIVGIQKASA